MVFLDHYLFVQEELFALFILNGIFSHSLINSLSL